MHGNEIEDRNNGQNLCKYSRHVPSSNLHNKPIAQHDGTSQEE